MWQTRNEEKKNVNLYAVCVGSITTYILSLKNYIDETTAAITVDVIRITCLLRTSMNFDDSRKNSFSFSFSRIFCIDRK